MAHTQRDKGNPHRDMRARSANHRVPKPRIGASFMDEEDAVSSR